MGGRERWRVEGEGTGKTGLNKVGGEGEGRFAEA